MKSIAEVDDLTLDEYNLLMEAYNLRQDDERLKIQALAYLTASASSVDKDGNALYPTFESFINPKRSEDRFAALREHLRKEHEKNGRKL